MGVYKRWVNWERKETIEFENIKLEGWEYPEHARFIVWAKVHGPWQRPLPVEVEPIRLIYDNAHEEMWEASAEFKNIWDDPAVRKDFEESCAWTADQIEEEIDDAIRHVERLKTRLAAARAAP